MNMPSKQRMVVKMLNGEDYDDTALRFKDDPRYVAALASLTGTEVHHLPQTPAVLPPRELKDLTPVLADGDERKRATTPHFMHSEDSVRDDYKSRNLGSRNDKVRDVSYDEAVQRLENQGLDAELWLHEVRRIITQADVIMAGVPPEHAAAARALQEALIELVGDAGDDDDEAGDAAACEACEPDESGTPTAQETMATAFFERVREELAWSELGALPSQPLGMLKASYNGCAGGLILTRAELLWVPMGAHFSQAQLRLPLGAIQRHAASCLKTPFGNRAELVVTRDESNPTASLRFACGSAIADTESFALEVDTVLATLSPAAATIASAHPGTSSAASSSPAPPPARRQTKQKTAAADLREKLKRILELQRSHVAGSNAQADELLAALKAGDGKEPSIHTIYKESEHLRDVALGFGGYALAKRVIEQFLKMPMVQFMLPDLLREQMDDACDAQTAKELLAQAKAFFTGIFGVGFRGGRLCDEDRNAVAAASAAILPRDLFAKRGRAAAASRLTGLGYRRLHRGSDARRELEDRACGWRRVRTAGHKDKVDYGPLNDFWHSDLASTEDNQNKHMVRDTFRSWPLHTCCACTCAVANCTEVGEASAESALGQPLGWSVLGCGLNLLVDRCACACRCQPTAG